MGILGKTPTVVSELASLLRGTTPSADTAYVGAETAYVLAKLSGQFVSSENEFVDSLNRIDCSIELRSDLMNDVLPLWNRLSRLQGRFDRQDCEAAVEEFARRQDLSNLGVSPSLVPLITKLLSSEPGGFMADIACGHGIVLAQALAEDDELLGEGVDSSRRNANFAEMLVARHKARCGICCMSAFDFVADHMWKYDKVFCFPPLGMRIDRISRWEEFQYMLPGAFPKVGAGCRSELLFALTAVAAMKETGRAVVLLPEGALFNQMSGAVAAREYLLDSGYLDCVVSLPDRMLERTQIGVSLLVLSRRENRSHVTMIDASGLGQRGRRFNTLSVTDVQTIVDAVYGFQGDGPWAQDHRKAIPVADIRAEGFNFSARYYFEKAALPSFDNPVRFGDVLEDIDRGVNIASSDMNDLPGPGEGECYYLSPSHIEDGIIAAKLPAMRTIPRKTPTLQDGDLILMRTGAISKIAVFENAFDKPVVISANLFVCRLKKDRVNPWFLQAFFESEGGKAVIASIAIGAAVKSVSIKSLEEMLIPLPPMQEQERIAADFKAKFRRLRELKREVESVSREMSMVFGAGKRGGGNGR